MTSEFPKLKNQILDDLLLTATLHPKAVRATLRVETLDGTKQHEMAFLVNGRVMTALHDLLQAVEDEETGGTP
jgi:hypothetical protein